MNVGIITLPMTNNFGGTLQAIALQQAVKNLGCNVTTMHWYSKDKYPQGNPYRYWRKWYFDRIFYYVRSKRIAKLTKAAKYRYSDYMHRHLKLQLCPFPFSSKFMERQQIDRWIVGGDQVFRYLFTPRQECMFLSFLTPELRRSCFSYSASFGTDEWEYPKELTEKCRHLITDFQAISVRESSGAELCRQHLGREACVMPDPTWLLTDEEYDDLMKEEQTPLPSRYAAYYILDETEEIMNWINRFCQQQQCSAIDMATDHNEFLGKGRRKHEIQQTPAFWLKALKNASYLITDSFHGMLFALMFRIPFICFGNTFRGNARFDMLSSLFNIKGRIVSPDAALSIPAYTKEENNYLITKRQELREEGLKFIAANLGIKQA